MNMDFWASVWLSVAIGNIHGAISGVEKSQKKVAARLNIERLKAIDKRTGVPLVLHGGTGIGKNIYSKRSGTGSQRSTSGPRSDNPMRRRWANRSKRRR